jgi:hypothetical protein
MKICVEYWWISIDKEKRKFSKKNLTYSDLGFKDLMYKAVIHTAQ